MDAFATLGCSEIRNPKHEIRNKFEIQIRKENFPFLDFEFWICFGFRISDLEFLSRCRLRRRLAQV
jgi:hypothetical protein